LMPMLLFALLSVLRLAVGLQRRYNANDLPLPMLASQDLVTPSELDVLRNIAVGINSGGPQAKERTEALRSTWLRYFDQHIIIGDVAVQSAGIEGVPKKVLLLAFFKLW